MKVVFILLDTLNRRNLKIYGDDKTVTPNIDRLASIGTVFDNHWCGSAPCMPARRDIMTGRINFLEKPWSGIEPYDVTLQAVLEQHDIYSTMITDHPHYLNAGGENYFHHFTSFEIFRGQCFDPWAIRPGKEGIVRRQGMAGYKGQFSEEYMANRERFKHCEEEHPTPKTFQTAAKFIEENAKADNYFMWVEGFDPHEPYDAPQEYADLYGDNYEGGFLFWPAYEYKDATQSEYTKEELLHLQRKYLGLITMTDKYIGKIMEALDKTNGWGDTLVILTTDHGFLLGEKDYLCKNYMPAYNEIFHIPMVAVHPEWKPKRIRALTQATDIFATVLDYFGIDPYHHKNRVHGHSILSLLSGEQTKIRDALIYGYFGKAVNVTDGRYTYLRAAEREDNQPLFVYGAMPTILRQFIGYDNVADSDLDKFGMGRFLPWTNFPVYKIPGDIINWGNWSQNFQKRPEYVSETRLYNIMDDYAQEHPVKDPELEKQYIELLRRLMREYDSPGEQFTRLGL